MTSTTPTTEAGTAPAPALAALYAALDGGDVAAASKCFAADALHASSPAGAVETAARIVATGREAIAGRLAELTGPARTVLQLCVANDTACLVEGVRQSSDGTHVETFAAHAWLGADGAITRYLEYTCPEQILPSPADAAGDTTGEPADARDALDRYFTALDGSEFRAAADVFSEDVLYSHPPYSDQPDLPGHRIDFRGRDELYTKSFSRRAPHALIHRVIDCVQVGPHAIVEGIVDGLPDGQHVTFISSLTLDAAGGIRRYASWCSRPAVPR